MAEQPAVKAVRWVRKPDAREVYCNYFNVNWSLYDVRIQFGQLIPDDQQKEVVALENASVTMSWHEAKLFKDFLANAIERFEKANYELKHLNPIL